MTTHVFICLLTREEFDGPDEVTFIAVSRTVDSAMRAGEEAVGIEPHDKGTWRFEEGEWLLYCGSPGRMRWLRVKEVELLS